MTPAAAFCKRVLVHGHHGFWAVTLSSALERLCRISFPQLCTDGQQFENADPAAIPGAAAFLAAVPR